MVATTKVYLFVCFLVLLIGFYFQREDYDWVYFQGVPRPDYAYFLLVLQWPPSFCNTGENKCREDVKDFSNFTIHGLWPQKEGRGIDCTDGPFFDYDKLRRDMQLINRMKKSWPNLTGEDEQFWRYQWDKHVKLIDLVQNDYFNKACSMKEIANLDETFATNGIRKGELYTIEKYREAIQKTLGVIPELRCNSRTQLVEVRLCVDKNGTKFQKCGTLDVVDDRTFQCNKNSRIPFPDWP